MYWRSNDNKKHARGKAKGNVGLCEWPERRSFFFYLCYVSLYTRDGVRHSLEEEKEKAQSNPIECLKRRERKESLSSYIVYPPSLCTYPYMYMYIYLRVYIYIHICFSFSVSHKGWEGEKGWRLKAHVRTHTTKYKIEPTNHIHRKKKENRKRWITKRINAWHMTHAAAKRLFSYLAFSFFLLTYWEVSYTHTF